MTHPLRLNKSAQIKIYNTATIVHRLLPIYIHCIVYEKLQKNQHVQIIPPQYGKSQI